MPSAAIVPLDETLTSTKSAPKKDSTLPPDALAQMKKMKSMREIHKERVILDNHIINPKSLVYRYWWRWTVFLILMFVFIMPVRLAFVGGDEGGPMAFMENFIDINFFVDILITFRLSFFRYGVLVTDPGTIATRYVRFQFWVDLVGCFPAAALFGSLVGESGMFALQLLGLLRFVRVARLAQFIRKMEQNYKYNYMMLALGKFLLIILLAGHISGCGLYLIARINNFTPGITWVGEFVPSLPSQPIIEQYVTSVYWGMTTLTTVGYGDFSPVGLSERIFTMCVMIVNMSISAYILGNMTLLATSQDAEISRQRNKMQSLNTFMQTRQIPSKFCKTALSHVQLTAELSKDDDTVLEQCPTFIRIKLLRFLYRDAFLQQYMFAKMSDQFFSQLVAEISVDNFFPGDYVYCAGDEPEAFYTIISGTADLLSGAVVDRSSMGGGSQNSQSQSRAKQSLNSTDSSMGKTLRGQKMERHLGPGCMFGEEAVLCDFAQPWTVQVKTLMRALQIKRSIWVSLAHKFPKEVRDIQKRMHAKIEETLKKNVGAKIDVIMEEVNRLVETGIAKDHENFVTALCFAASRGDTMDVRRLIKNAGLAPNSGDYDGRAPIHLAAVGGHLETIAFLLEQGADPSLTDNFGTTPLQESVQRGHDKVSEILIKSGGELKLPDAGSKLCSLAAEGFTKELGEYLKYGINPDEADYDKRNALHLASAEGILPCVKVLVEYKADVNFADRWGQTALDEAIAAEQKHIIKFLKEHGAEPGKKPS